jgi:hypothetical protein
MVPHSYTVPRIIFLVAALDSLVATAWSLSRPNALFSLLDLTTPQDAFLWPVLGGLSLAHAAFLLVAARQKTDAGFAWVAVIGRAVQCGLWLWLLGTDRVHAAPLPLALLVGHDAVILALVAAGIVLARRTP